MTTTTNGLRLKLAGLTATLAAIATIGLGASPASATAYAYGGSGTTTLSCGYTGLYHDVLVKPQTGFGYNQLVGYRMYVSDLTTGAGTWTGWTTFAASQRIQGWHTPANHNYQIYMQYAWQDARGNWTYAGEWITSYVHRTGGTPTYLTYCAEW
jgi:hypothetical protein